MVFSPPMYNTTTQNTFLKLPPRKVVIWLSMWYTGASDSTGSEAEPLSQCHVVCMVSDGQYLLSKLFTSIWF